MGVKTQQQVARLRVREVRSDQAEVRKARERRLEDLAVRVLVAIGTIADQQRIAGEALREMIDDEGLSLREAVGWCGEEISSHTAARFKRLISQASDEAGSSPNRATGNLDR